MHLLYPVRSVIAAFDYWLEDAAWEMGAALAYYALFSLAPVLVVASAIIAVAFGESLDNDQVMNWVTRMVGGDGATVIDILTESLRRTAQARWPAVIGIASFSYGALGLRAQLRRSLNRILRAQRTRQGSFIGFVGRRVIWIIAVLLFSVLAVTLLIVSALPSTFDDLNKERYGDIISWSWRFFAVDFMASSCLVGICFAVVYRFASDGHVYWRHIWGGTMLAAVLFTLGKIVVGDFLGRNLVFSAYGAAGSLFVFLIWVYYSTQVFLLGAEAVRVRLGKRGSRTVGERSHGRRAVHRAEFPVQGDGHRVDSEA